MALAAVYGMCYNIFIYYVRRQGCAMGRNRVNIFTGHFGSGKTELSINYALELKKYHKKVAIVDLDIVNPFFRTSEQRDMLVNNDIRIIMPNFATTTVDVSSLPPDILSVFENENWQVVLDVGGDDLGARVLGTYYHHLSRTGYRMYYVINIKRPLSSTADDIVDMLREIENSSRLRVTDLVNNTNLSNQTRTCDIINGQDIIIEVSKSTGLPITMVAGTEDILSRLPREYRHLVFPIKLYMKPPWN